MQDKLKYVECAVSFAQGNRKLNITILGFTSVLECSLGTLSIRHAYANTYWKQKDLRWSSYECIKGKVYIIGPVHCEKSKSKIIGVLISISL